MKKVAISEFKAKCLSLLEPGQKTKTPIRVTRFGKPSPKLCLYQHSGQEPAGLELCLEL